MIALFFQYRAVQVVDGIGFEPATWRFKALFQPGYNLMENNNKRDPSQYEWKKGGDIRNDR